MRSPFMLALGIVAGIVITWIFQSLQTNALPPIVSWLDILLCFLISGAFGGILGALQLTDIPTLLRSSLSAHWSPWRSYNVCLALFIGSLGGMGGAIGAMLVMAIDEKIKAPPVLPLDRLTYIGVGTVAGFLGFKLLGKIAERVGTWLEIEKEVKKQVERSTAEATVHERRRSEELLGAITKGIAAQEPEATPIQVEEGIRGLESVRGEAPDNRTAAMMLSWFYGTKRGDPKKAIAVLTDALAAMKARNTDDAQNVGDLLYNRACYHYRLWDTAGEHEKPPLKERMYQDLEESIRLKPENATFAANEVSDFTKIRPEARFQTITGTRAQQAVPAAQPAQGPG